MPVSDTTLAGHVFGKVSLAGCTDVGLWVTKLHKQYAQVLDTTAAAELRQIARVQHGGQTWLSIGAAVRLSDAFAALEKNNLKPVADADRRTWLRRVTLDLVGRAHVPPEGGRRLQCVAHAGPVDEALGRGAGVGSCPRPS